MFLQLPFAVLLSSLLVNAKSCSLLGLNFPKPTALDSRSSFANGTATLAQLLTQAVSTGTTRFGPLTSNVTSFSVQIFSLSNNSLLEFHHTSPQVAEGKAGVRAVDSNTVYRIGSITKLITAFTFLVEAGDARWEDPLTNYIPELRDQASNGGGVDQQAWSEISLGSLAQHLSGVGRDDWWTDISAGLPEGSALALPVLNASHPALCGPVPCVRDAFFKTLLADSNPVTQTFSTPVYSNSAFQLLGYALESITLRSMKDLMETDIFKRLDMTRTTYGVPETSNHSVIPGDPIATGWALSGGDLTPAGGVFSSANDMAKLGIAILNSTFLKPHQTRKWMKPTSHTADPAFSLGRPWEIYRYENKAAEGRIIDIYTKGGDIGAYSTTIGLLPEFGFGYTVLSAGAKTTALVSVLSNVIADTLIPAAEEAARQEADEKYSGTYSDGNSTITITTEKGQNGLIVTKWISDGSNVFEGFKELRGVEIKDIRLYSTGINTGSAQAFRGIPQSATPVTNENPLNEGCGWFLVDGLRYQNQALDDFLITVVEDGKASSVEPRAWRTVLRREV